MTRRQALLALLGLTVPLPIPARPKQVASITLIGTSFDYDAIATALIPEINAALGADGTHNHIQPTPIEP